MVQQLAQVKIVESSNLHEIKTALTDTIYVPDIRVREHVIEELITYLGDKRKNPEYKVKVFIAYQKSEIRGFVISQLDPYYTSYSRPCGTFGWLHAKDFETCSQLIKKCEQFTKENKIRKIRGNISFPKNLGGLGIQVRGFKEQMLYGVGYTDPEAQVLEYLPKLGYTPESEYTCVYVDKMTWDKGKTVDNNIRLWFPTLEELYEHTEDIRNLANDSFYQIMPDGSGRNRILDFFYAYMKLPPSFYTLAYDIKLEEYSTIPAFIEAWKSCDLEKIQPYVPMAFDRSTDELVGIILCLPDLYQLWRGEPITRINVDTAMVKKGYYGKGIFSAMNNIGQLTCIMRGLNYFEGTSIWSNNTRAIDTIFPHSIPIRKHMIFQKRIK